MQPETSRPEDLQPLSSTRENLNLKPEDDVVTGAALFEKSLTAAALAEGMDLKNPNEASEQSEGDKGTQGKDRSRQLPHRPRPSTLRPPRGNSGGRR
jgi:hypothetical protein